MSSFLEILKCNKNCVKNISKYLRLLSEIDVEKDKQELKYLLSKLLSSSDNLVHNSRQIPLELGVEFIDGESVYDYTENLIVESSGVKVDYIKENWLALRLPAIPPKRGKTYSQYLILPLEYALQKFFQGQPFQDERKMVLTYRFVYSNAVPRKSYRDYDNLEVKKITDILVSHTTISDHPTIINNYYCSAQGEEIHTEVFLVPEEEFPSWLEWEKTISKEGVLA